MKLNPNVNLRDLCYDLMMFRYIITLISLYLRKIKQIFDENISK